MPKFLTDEEMEKALASERGPSFLSDEEMEKALVAEQPSQLSALGRGAAQGATLGYIDEIAARIGVNVEKLKDRRNFTYSDGDTYQQKRDAYREKDKAAKAAHPWTYGGGEVGGMLATSIVPGGAVLKGAQGATKLAKVGKLTGVGAGFGGVQAAGISEAETVGGLAQDTALGTVIGAAAGGGGELVIPFVAKIVGKKLTNLMQTADKNRVLRELKELGFDVRGDKVYSEYLAEFGAAIGEEVGESVAWNSPTLGHMVELAREGILPKGWFRTDSKMLKLAQEMEDKLLGGAARARKKATASTEAAQALDLPSLSDPRLRSKAAEDQLAALGARESAQVSEQITPFLSEKIAKKASGSGGLEAIGRLIGPAGGIGAITGGALGGAGWGAAGFAGGKLARKFGNQGLIKAWKGLGKTSKWGATLSKALQEGPEAMASTHFILWQTYPDYRESMEDFMGLENEEEKE